MLNIAQTRQNMSFAQAVKRSIECFFFSEKSHWYDTIFFTSFQWQVFCLSNFFRVLTKWRLKFVPNYVCNHDKLIGVLSCRHPPLFISPVITNQIGLHSSYYYYLLIGTKSRKVRHHSHTDITKPATYHFLKW